MVSSQDWIARVSILVIIVSLAFIGVTLTGNATDAGTVNITIVSTAAINFTNQNVNFGAGAVDNLELIANLYTNNNSVSDGNWTSVPSGLVLRNIGNINVKYCC